VSTDWFLKEDSEGQKTQEKMIFSITKFCVDFFIKSIQNEFKFHFILHRCQIISLNGFKTSLCLSKALYREVSADEEKKLG